MHQRLVSFYHCCAAPLSDWPRLHGGSGLCGRHECLMHAADIRIDRHLYHCPHPTFRSTAKLVADAQIPTQLLRCVFTSPVQFHTMQSVTNRFTSTTSIFLSLLRRSSRWPAAAWLRSASRLHQLACIITEFDDLVALGICH